MSNKLTVAGVVLALALGVVGLFTGNVTNPVVERTIERVGGSGQNDSFHKFFGAGATHGGVMATTSSKSTFTLTAADLRDHSVILWTPNLDLTLSLGATSTYEMVPNVGDSVSVYLLNASSTAASAITFAAADSSSDLQFSESTGGDLVLNGLDWEKITIIRKATTGVAQVAFLLDEMTEAD